MSNIANGKLTRRSMLQGTAAMATFAGFSSWIGKSAAAANELRIIMAGGSWGEFFSKAVADPFATQHPMEYVWKHGLNQEPVLMAQKRRPQWDLVHSSQVKAGQLLEMGVYREFKESEIPNISLVHPVARFPQLVGKGHSPYGLAVNTKLVTKPITSWEDLWDPEFAGKVGFPAWGWMGEELFHALNLLFGGTLENVDVGIERLKELVHQNKAIIMNNAEHSVALADSEEILIYPQFKSRVVQAQSAGKPLEFIIPKEGGMNWVWNTALVANRPEVSNELANEFVNYSLTAEPQLILAELGVPPTNMEAMENLPDKLAHLRLTSEDLDRLGTMQKDMDYMAMFAFRDQYAERWNKEVLSLG